MAESLHCSPERITTLLIRYTPIKNVFSVKKTKLKKIFKNLPYKAEILWLQHEVPSPYQESG